jgi:4a-hydroxytetrahydrobiopterin dehydratase
MSNDTLTAEELHVALGHIPGWTGDPTAITRQYRLPDFPTAIDLVVAVADVAEKLDHHPDIDVRWRAVTFTLSTHSAGGVTSLDVRLAGRIQDLADARGAEPPA